MDLIKATEEYNIVDKYLQDIEIKDILLKFTIDDFFESEYKDKLYIIYILYIYINKTNDIDFYIKQLSYFISNILTINNTEFYELNITLNLIYIFYKNIYILLNTYIFSKLIYYSGSLKGISNLVDLIIYLHFNNSNYYFYNLFYIFITSTNIVIYARNTSYSNIITDNYIDFYTVFSNLKNYNYYSYRDKINKQIVFIKDIIIKAENRKMSINRIHWFYAVYRGIKKCYSCFVI